MTLPRYAEYKDSGVAWLGRIPSHWQIHPTKRHFRRRKEVNSGMACENRLALTMNGVVPRSLEALDGLQSNDYEGYQLFEPGDLAFKLIDLQNVKTSRVGLVPERGIMSPAYIRLQPMSTTDNRFAYWYFMALYWTQVFNSLGGGVRQTLGSEELLAVDYPLPPLVEQTAIAAFLDGETAKIDRLITEQDALIGLLAEKRLATISHFITRGLNGDVATKDSGVGWLGTVPAHWTVLQLRHFVEVLRGKFTHRPRNDPAFYDGDYPFVQTGDITGADRYLQSFRQTLNERGAAVSKRFPSGTLVMAIAANIGDVAILNFPAYFPDSIVGMIPKAGVELQYLYYLLIAMKSPMLQTATVSTQMNLNVDQITSLAAALPPVDEQNNIVEMLDFELAKLDKLRFAAIQGISLLKERRTALIAATVTGQIDVRGAFTPLQAREDEALTA